MKPSPRYDNFPRPPDAAAGHALPETVGELFCGAGGMTSGFVEAGFRCVAAIDNWVDAVAVHRANLGDHASCVDIRDVNHVVRTLSASRPTILCGGPPCQDFSAAGKRVEGQNASMTLTFGIVCVSVRPEWILMENVPRAKDSLAWQETCAMLRRAGYGLTVMVVNAALYGVPQKRKRLIVIGRLGEREQFLESSVRNAASPAEMTLHDLFGDSLGHHFYHHPRNPDRSGVVSVFKPYRTVRNAPKRQPPGYRPHRGDSNVVDLVFFRGQTGARAVFSVNESAPTVLRTTRERPREAHLAHPHPADAGPAERAHVLSQEETAAIQGFARDWDWSAARLKRDVDQMIANAVPRPLARALATVILRRHRGETVPLVEGNWTQWLARRGMNRQMVCNQSWRLRRAWMMLGGRTFADPALEMAALERCPAFRAMNGRMQSSFRVALRLHREWLSDREAGRTRPGKPRRGTAAS